MMDEYFWQQRWEKNEIAFHEAQANRHLVKYFSDLSLEKGSRVFLPLCGKTLDIPWLLNQGYRVAGAELSKIAIAQLFKELGVNPEISELDKIARYSAKNIDIFVGNIFDLSAPVLGPVDAIYDRAALVALPQNMRPRYAAHLAELSHKAPQLLICYEYDQNLMSGPPFSIGSVEVHQLYSDRYELTLLDSMASLGGLKGCAAKENIWLLK